MVEGRGLAKGKTLECNRFRTQSRQILSNTLERIRQARTKDGSERGYHSYSSTSIGVMTQGKSRMRQYRMSGSVRGAAREGGSYRDRFNVRRLFKLTSSNACRNAGPSRQLKRNS